MYVIESSVNINNLELAAHGYEGFYARGWVVIKTGENETYRITDKVLEFFDLSVFCFRAPYHFKHESKLLKVEVGLKGRKLRKIESMIRRTRKRKRGKPCHSSFDEEEEEGDEEEEEMDEVIKERDIFLDDVLVEEPDHSGNNYLMSRNDDEDPPFRPCGDGGDGNNGIFGNQSPEQVMTSSTKTITVQIRDAQIMQLPSAGQCNFFFDLLVLVSTRMHAQHSENHLQF